MKVDVAGLKIDAITKTELLKTIEQRVANKQKTFISTPYSEFLYAAVRNKQTMELLNRSDFAIADGVGILWADLFLSRPLTWPSLIGKVIQSWLQVVWTGASILLYPKLIYKNIPEKIVGASLIWDLAELAAKNNFSIFLLGSKGNISYRAAQKLQQRFPTLKVAGSSNKNPHDDSAVEEINNSGADMVFVTYNALVQEQWIDENLPKLNASFAIGLGGTFDYIVGNKKQPPMFIRKVGLEWLYRLITQPSRLFRIYRGFWGLILSLVKIKIHNTFSFRKNACAVVINKEGKILLCQRTRSKWGTELVDYWQFPQGGIDDGEDLVTASTRELEEETGINSVKVLGIANYKNYYTWSNASHQLIPPRQFRHKGQEQDTVFFLFTGNDSEIKLDMHEFTNYKWLNRDEVLEVINIDRREHAQKVLAELDEISL